MEFGSQCGWVMFVFVCDVRWNLFICACVSNTSACVVHVRVCEREREYMCVCGEGLMCTCGCERYQ